MARLGAYDALAHLAERLTTLLKIEHQHLMWVENTDICRF